MTTDFKTYKYTKFNGVYSTTLEFWEQPQDERSVKAGIMCILLGIILAVIIVNL